MFGFLNVDKPSGMTSRDVVNRVQRLIRPVKVGHTGTLDPLATGVLVLAIGSATRLSQFVLQHSKSYVGQFRFGQTSDTDDCEGTITTLENCRSVSKTELAKHLANFRGPIQQIPPVYSAIKVNGKRAYALARKGEKIELTPREVTVHELDLLEFDYPNFSLKVTCSSGTYIRSIGRDIGVQLKSGALMTALTRTSVGCFDIADAIAFDAIDLDEISEHLISPLMCLDQFPRTILARTQIEPLLDGKMIGIETDSINRPDPLCSIERVVAVDETNQLIAIMDSRDMLYKPTINFVKEWLPI